MPSSQMTDSPGLRVLSLLAGAALLFAGCSKAWTNSFLDPSQSGNFDTHEIVEIQNSISICDEPGGVPGAEEPTAEDLVAVIEEYRIGPGDVLSVRLLDFLQIGSETDLTPLTVNELGKVFIPQLGLIPVEGFTAYELQSEIVLRGKQEGIYNPDDQPTVTVSVVTAQQRTFQVSGAVAQPGMYPIVRPDFRLREAIQLPGGLDQSVKHIWVIRGQPREKVVREPKMDATRRGGPDTRPEEPPPAPPVSPVSMNRTSAVGGPTAPDGPNNTRPAARLAVPTEQAEQELQEAIGPGVATDVPAPAAPAAPVEASPTTGTGRPSWIYVNDQFIEAPATQPMPQPEATPEAASQPSQESVDWEKLADEGQQRIIHVPADKLRNGDPNYNIVVRHDDFIRLDPGPVGVFYLDGHVVRPGVYDFRGEEITLRQAIASAGGLDPLAWPTRCSITRRLESDREETLQLDLARILEAKDPDFYLKPNDLIVVGTHAIAPILLTIRNSFRLTYGFGFVYDRNFADIDAYIPKQNPEDRRRALLQTRFPGLFP